MHQIDITLPGQNYSIYIKENIQQQIGDLLTTHIKGKKVVLISDTNVDSLHGEELKSALTLAGYEICTILLAPGEQSKTLSNLSRIYDELMQFELTKSDAIIAFGGGVVGDIAGFAAATFARGIPYIQIPTTLLAQVDSSIGGKTAINHENGKNMIGAFYHPQFVLINPLYLETLPAIFFTDGMAEVIKYGCIYDRELFEMLLALTPERVLESPKEIIARCCMLKKKAVESDEFDQGERMKLNFGHTIGHAIENKLSHTGITHGMGVAIGMYTITKNAEILGLTPVNTSEMIKELLMQYRLPYELPNLPKEELLEIMVHDKKSRSNQINLILLKKIGKSYIHTTTKNQMKDFL